MPRFDIQLKPSVEKDLRKLPATVIRHLLSMPPRHFRSFITFLTCIIYPVSEFGVSSAIKTESARVVADARRKERELWGVADAATLWARGHMLKAGIWWSLFHVPMEAPSGTNCCPKGDCGLPVRVVEQPSLWPPLWAAVRSVAEFMPFHRHAVVIPRISSLQGSAIGCLRWIP
jgi:hypothetical protein